MSKLVFMPSSAPHKTRNSDTMEMALFAISPMGSMKKMHTQAMRTPVLKDAIAKAHDHPFGDLGKEAAFDDAAEAEADDRDERGGYHRHPYRHTFAECHFIHTPLFYYVAPSGPPVILPADFRRRDGKPSH